MSETGLEPVGVLVGVAAEVADVGPGPLVQDQVLLKTAAVHQLTQTKGCPRSLKVVSTDRHLNWVPASLRLRARMSN